MYVHRFTAEHVPGWARGDTGFPGRFYAPQFASDREWYDHTTFPGEEGHLALGDRDSCHTSGQTWPFGQWLPEPYRKDDPPPRPVSVGPRVGVTLTVDGDSAGFEHVDLEHAAEHVAKWIRRIEPSEAGMNFRVEIEILDEDA